MQYTKEDLLAKGIDMEAGIENCGGMDDFYYEIVDDFENEEKRVELKEAFEENDMKKYSIAVHSIKGILKMIGATEVGNLAEKLQYASEADDVETVKQYHDELSEKIEEVIQLIKATK